MQKEISDFCLHYKFNGLIPFDYDQHFNKKSFFSKVYEHQKTIQNCVANNNFHILD